MPTENEKKYVLKRDTEEDFKNRAVTKGFIWQGYLFSSKGSSVRLRKLQGCRVSKVTHYLTLKSSVNGRVVEIENTINERDFNDLWTQCMNKLEKIRYVIPDKKEKIWEIDFFKDHNKENYFCLAEFEMPEDQLQPEFMPNWIKDILLYDVPLTDCRFSSKLLADVRYANDIYKELRNGKTI